MKNKRSNIVSGILKGRFSLLLFSMALMFFVAPLLSASQGLLDKTIQIFSWIVLFSCLRAITERREFFILMVGLSLLNMAIGIPEMFSENGAAVFRTAGFLVRLLYFSLVFLSVMKYVLNKSPVCGDKICGAISAYILMGIIWAVVYGLFEHLHPGSFSGPGVSDGGGMWALYYSFTTLTTLGYGDITPVLSAAQSYAFMEAACGQIFLTVLIARLVALQINHSTTRTES